jgi:hypothetical protein
MCRSRELLGRLCDRRRLLLNSVLVQRCFAETPVAIQEGVYKSLPDLTTFFDRSLSAWRLFRGRLGIDATFGQDALVFFVMHHFAYSELVKFNPGLEAMDKLFIGFVDCVPVVEPQSNEKPDEKLQPLLEAASTVFAEPIELLKQAYQVDVSLQTVQLLTRAIMSMTNVLVDHLGGNTGMDRIAPSFLCLTINAKPEGFFLKTEYLLRTLYHFAEYFLMAEFKSEMLSHIMTLLHAYVPILVHARDVLEYDVSYFLQRP